MRLEPARPMVVGVPRGRKRHADRRACLAQHRLAVRIHRPHLQCAFRLASRDRSTRSPHAARKPRFAPRPLLHAGEGAMPGSLSRTREKEQCPAPSPASGRGLG